MHGCGVNIDIVAAIHIIKSYDVNIHIIKLLAMIIDLCVKKHHIHTCHIVLQ